MLTRLKFTLVTLLAGGLLASCSSDEPAATSSCEMKFDISSISRSSTTLSNITEQPFAIFGDRTPAETTDNPPARTIIYKNVPVTFTGSYWVTPAPQYWFNKHDHSFVAIHPASVLSNSDVDLQYLNSQLSFTYTIPTDHTLIPDILVATHRRRYIDQKVYDDEGNLLSGSPEVVYLRFVHLMSQINLAPAFDDNIMDKEGYIEFRRLELSGFKTKATLKITPASFQTITQTDDRVTEVINSDETDKLTIDFTSPKRIYNDGKNVALLDYNDAIIMLPQTIEATSDAQILLTFTMSGEVEEKQVSLPLAGCNWESGKTYTYKCTIDRTGLVLGSTTITDWDVTDVGNIDAH